jgi:hypothetical protein
LLSLAFGGWTYATTAWNRLKQDAGWYPDAPFDQQGVLVTVPASFDAIARELTGNAAEAAGYRNLTMLEEPQAAFYAGIQDSECQLEPKDTSDVRQNEAFGYEYDIRITWMVPPGPGRFSSSSDASNTLLR